ncbi:DUF4132 domain-containing protein [Actinomadura alba]|uniref:DUF4132 domain-containing protein n=1 Tax=Actinomadura alba TaxID=406431 RepID=A0ABR7LSH9_9ACTN|nr:DUF4132 domain-containing protein [Actinomadura alba]MBC6467798.1 DUF4132 domain-containing protein [Actinomadura alba]
MKFKGVKARAQEKIEEVARELELTPEQLADRLVPDFGLGPEGGLTLDYGSRRFVVGFDEQLRPYVNDGRGRRLKALPRPGVKDDDEPAHAAYKRFAALKKDVRAAAGDQIRRLESAMVARRRWTAAEFQILFVAHPLLWHIARRLVWLSEDGGKVTAFRVAEDRTFADAGDVVLTLPESASIGIAHPLDLGEELAAWVEVFADYEILQPFPQLGRPVDTLTDEEARGGRLHRFEGLTVPFGKVLGLERRGWRRGEPLDGGVECWISRETPGGLHIVISLDPGIQAGHVQMLPEQRLEHVWLGAQPGDYDPDRVGPYAFGELDPVTASEILTDLTELAESAV